jgi:predicted DNA-binding transcriptional regulator AlpA
MTRCRRRQHAVRKPKVMLMPDPMAGLPPRLLRTPDAARFLGISNRTLEKHRTYGTGPVYRKMGGRVVYAVEDLQAWSAIGARKSTTDQTAQRVFPARRLTAAERGAR